MPPTEETNVTLNLRQTIVRDLFIVYNITNYELVIVIKWAFGYIFSSSPFSLIVHQETLCLTSGLSERTGYSCVYTYTVV